MVRTKADRVPRKAIGEKSSVKKIAVGRISTPKKTSSRGGKKHSSGNPYHPRETPKWQKTITCFMNVSETTSEATAGDASSSKEDQDPDIEETLQDEDDETD